MFSISKETSDLSESHFAALVPVICYNCSIRVNDPKCTFLPECAQLVKISLLRCDCRVKWP